MTSRTVVLAKMSSGLGGASQHLGVKLSAVWPSNFWRPIAADSRDGYVQSVALLRSRAEGAPKVTHRGSIAWGMGQPQKWTRMCHRRGLVDWVGSKAVLVPSGRQVTPGLMRSDRMSYFLKMPASRPAIPARGDPADPACRHGARLAGVSLWLDVMDQ